MSRWMRLGWLLSDIFHWAGKKMVRWLQPRDDYVVVKPSDPHVSPVTPGDPTTYERAMYDCLAQAEKARDDFFEYKAQLMERYLNSRVRRTRSDAEYLALKHPSVQQAARNNRLYERWANQYANAIRAMKGT